jgi:hypothetical protein
VIPFIKELDPTNCWFVMEKQLDLDKLVLYYTKNFKIKKLEQVVSM